MSRRQLQTDNITAVRTRTAPVIPTATPEMVAMAQAAFLASKEANAANTRARKTTTELAKLMVAGKVDTFNFVGETPTGGQVQARAAIEPYPVDEIDVGALRGLISDNQFMQVIKATKGAVEEICGSHIAIKATKTAMRPAELKIKEVK